MTTPAPQMRDAAPSMVRLAQGSALAPRSINETERTIDFLCSTDRLDSYETMLRQNWQLDRYLANPVVLFAHKSREMPIGTASNVRVTGLGLEATIRFATEDINPEAERAWKAAKAGLLRGVSVGFNPRTYRFEKHNDVEVLVLDDNELLELSVCPVPANPDALARTASAPGADDHPGAVFLDSANSLDALRARARASSPTPTKDSTMDKELEALRSTVSAKDAEIAVSKREHDLTRADVDKVKTELTEVRASLSTERAARTAAEEKVALLTRETERVGKELTEATERATAAEDKLVRSEVESLVGRSVDPSEVDHFVALKRSMPALFDAEMKRRTASGRNDQLTEKAIPGDAPAQRSDGAHAPDTTTNFNAALSRHMPKDA